MKTEIVPRTWDNQTCVVAAPGPSLTQEVADRCKGIRTIAVTDAYKLMPWADVLYSCDSGWWQVHEGAAGFNGQRWSTHDDGGNDKTWVAAEYRVRVVAGKKADGFSGDPAVIHYGDNSCYQAVNLAIHFGAARIILVGANMQSVNGKTHCAGVDRTNGRLRACTDYRRFVPHFEKAAETLPPWIEIINATPNSALRCFPMMALDEALALEPA
jgi:hypothetical protein